MPQGPQLSFRCSAGFHQRFKGAVGVLGTSTQDVLEEMAKLWLAYFEEHRTLPPAVSFGGDSSTGTVPKTEREEKANSGGKVAFIGDYQGSLDLMAEIEKLVRVLSSKNRRAKNALRTNLDAFDHWVKSQPGEEADGQADSDAATKNPRDQPPRGPRLAGERADGPIDDAGPRTQDGDDRLGEIEAGLKRFGAGKSNPSGSQSKRRQKRK